jgi:hypothetical protein
MRDIPKARVAALVHDRGLLAGLIAAADSGTEIAPAALALLDAIVSPSIQSIDLDDAQYQAGVAGLVAYGVISQADADAVEALYVTPIQWAIESIASDHAIIVSDTGAREKITLLVASDISSIIARRNEGI